MASHSTVIFLSAQPDPLGGGSVQQLEQIVPVRPRARLSIWISTPSATETIDCARIICRQLVKATGSAETCWSDRTVRCSTASRGDRDSQDGHGVREQCRLDAHGNGPFLLNTTTTTLPLRLRRPHTSTVLRSPTAAPLPTPLCHAGTTTTLLHPLRSIGSPSCPSNPQPIQLLIPPVHSTNSSLNASTVIGQ